MAEDGGYVFESEEDVRRLARLLLRQERSPLNPKGPQIVPASRAPIVQAVRLTSTTTSVVDGRTVYPGVIERYNWATGAWDAYAACWVVDANP